MILRSVRNLQYHGVHYRPLYKHRGFMSGLPQCGDRRVAQAHLYELVNRHNFLISHVPTTLHNCL